MLKTLLMNKLQWEDMYDRVKNYADTKCKSASEFYTKIENMFQSGIGKYKGSEF